MSSTLPFAASTFEPSAAGRRRFPSPQWTREPLLHFVILGAVLFGLDHYLVTRADDPHTIVIDAKVDDEAKQVFKASRGRAPNTDELYALRRVWLDNEVLYREGLALQLDRGDPAIRERVIFKALSMVDAGTKLPPIDDAELRKWFEEHRAKYDVPARYDFEEAVPTGKVSDDELQRFAKTLNANAADDMQAGLRVFKDRPRDNVVQSYGIEFAAALDTLKTGEWHALTSQAGLRVIRLKSVTPAKPAAFELLRGVVLQDWTDATLAAQRSEAVRKLAKKYTVKIERTAQ